MESNSIFIAQKEFDKEGFRCSNCKSYYTTGEGVYYYPHVYYCCHCGFKLEEAPSKLDEASFTPILDYMVNPNNN